MPIENAYQSITDLPDLKLFKRMECGAVYTQNHHGKYNVVIDESGLADLLSPEDLEDVALIKVLDFKTEQERSAYLLARFGAKGKP